MNPAQTINNPSTSRDYVSYAPREQKYLFSCAIYLGSGLLAILIACLLMQLWHADFTVPLYTGGPQMDTYTVCAGVKNLIENGAIYSNSFLGAPGKLEYYDFPSPPAVNHILLLKLVSLFSSNYAVVLNTSFLLSFALITWTSLFVLRRLGISYPAAIFASLLYTFLPYHFFRGEHHFYLALYYVVPLTVMLLVWVANGEELFRFRRRRGEWLVSRKGTAAIAICVLMTLDSPYYSFFGAILLIIAAILAIPRSRSRAVSSVTILLVVIALTFILGLLPSFVYFHQHGRNSEVAVREPKESELYGLKLTQLVLPVTGHRLPRFAELKNKYSPSPSQNENDFASLGLVGSCGFLLLLALTVFGNLRNRFDALLRTLGVLNVSAFFVGTVGGLGSLFALLVSPQIRSLNRISIFIAFFSLAAIALLIDRLRPHLKSYAGMIAWYGGILLLLALGILDQTAKSFVPQHRALQAQFSEDAAFVDRIENSVPANAMIFQLPYEAFPEGGPKNKMNDYDPLIGYMHSRHLRWSFGAMRGRATDIALRQIASERPDEMIRSAVFAGFSGIYVDRFGYKDAEKLESQLRSDLGNPITSANGRLSFYSLASVEARLRAQYNDAEWQHLRETTLHPVVTAWEDSCWPLEGTQDDNWHWCPATGVVRLANASASPKKVVFEMTLATGFSEPSHVRIATPWEMNTYTVSDAGTPVQQVITIPPGSYSFRFFSDGKVLTTPTDSRSMVFRVNNFHIKMLD